MNDCYTMGFNDGIIRHKERLKEQINHIFNTSIILIRKSDNEPADIYHINSEEFKEFRNKVLKLLECEKE